MLLLSHICYLFNYTKKKGNKKVFNNNIVGGVQMNKKYLIIVIVFIVILIMFFFFTDNSNNKQTDDVVALENNDIKVEEKVEKIIVDIKGAVNKPGIYEIENNKRVNDVIKLAGGLKKNANTNYINLSAKVKDEMVIWVYTTNEIEKLKLQQSSTEYMIKECNCPVVDNTACLNIQTSNSNKNNRLININTASLEDFMSLSGVGESKAQAIIDYRHKNGNFKTKEDIMNVTGIGESLYNKIKDFITV